MSYFNEEIYLKSTSEELFKIINSLDSSFFSSFNALAEERYGIPEEVCVRKLKKILIVGRDRYKAIKEKYGIFSKIVFWIYYFMIKFLPIILPKHKKGKLRAKVVFEIWSGEQDYRFYKNIHNKLKCKCSVAFSVLRKQVVNKDLLPKFYFPIYRVSKRVAKEVLIHERKGIFSESFDIDPRFLWGQFLKAYIILKTQIDCLDTKVFITACDHSMTSLRYWLMKQAGISLIILLQNGLRTPCINSGGAYYNTTDLYEVYGLKQKELLEKQGCEAREWLPMGNLFLLNQVENLKFSNEGPITVIGHDFSYRIGDYNIEDFNLILRYIRDFSIRHKIPVKYIARTGSTNERTNYELNMASRWTEYDDKTNCYEAVALASICVNYLSSLGTEAIGMGKKVLFFNFYDNDFVISNKDEPSVVITKNYDEFEKKIITLLQDQSAELNRHFEKLKQERMTLNNKIFDLIADRCMNHHG